MDLFASWRVPFSLQYYISEWLCLRPIALKTDLNIEAVAEPRLYRRLDALKKKS
jgi:hypothetical protein